MVQVRMSDSEDGPIPRQPEEPTPQQVLETMNRCEPYTVSDLRDDFSDASRWTIQRRLDALVDDSKLSKKKHSENRVSYWIPE